MKRDSILALMRHLLTFAGGGLATGGLATDDEVGQLVGAVVTIIGVVWSIMEKRARSKASVQVNVTGGGGALLLALGLVLAGGCATPERAAYRTLGTTATVVDGVMKGWGNWVRAGRATAADEAHVKAVYERYQAGMALARIAVATARADPKDQSGIEAALAAVEAQSGDLVRLIEALIGRVE